MKLIFFVFCIGVLPLFAMEEQKDTDPLHIRKIVETALAQQGNLNDVIYHEACRGASNPEAFVLAVSRNDAYTDLLEILLKKDVDITVKNPASDNNIVHTSLEAPLNLRKVIHHLKEKKCEALLEDTNCVNESPLFYAIAYLYLQGLQVLLEHGVSANKVGRSWRVSKTERYSPLSYSFRMFSDEKHLNSFGNFSRSLLIYGADVGTAYNDYLKMPNAYQKKLKEVLKDIKVFHNLKSLNHKDTSLYLSRLPSELFVELCSFCAGINASKCMNVQLPLDNYEKVLSRKPSFLDSCKEFLGF